MSASKTILVDAIHCFVIKHEGVFQQMYDLLESFPNRKIILTGANDQEIKENGLDKMPYELFALKHNPEKVDPNYYRRMLEKFSLGKDDVIYFEHSNDAVESARSVGINTYLYDSEKRDLKALREFLVKSI